MENDKKQIIIQTSLGSVYTPFGEDELNKLTKKDKMSVAISGKINNPGIIKVPEGASLRDIINMSGGIIKDEKFKGAQLGIPFGSFITKDDLDKSLDFKLFHEEEGVSRTIIILSDEDCIIQYAKFYIDYLIGKIKQGSFEQLKIVEDEIVRMWKILDTISKGKATMRDVYLLRRLANTAKEKTNKTQNIILAVIDNYYDEIEEHIEENKCITSQCLHLIKLRITEKCIGCTACTRVCPVSCIHGEKRKQHFIDYNRCTHCGQCITICPVNAIYEGDNTVRFIRDLVAPNKVVITQMAPAIRVTIGEAFGFEPGTNVEKKLAAALRRLGVDYVFDTTWAADLTIMEEAAEMIERFKKYFSGDKDVKLPILTSCCPAWVKFIEQNYADMLEIPSSAKSPMQMFASVAKDIWAKEKGLRRDEVTSVAIMPCVAKKYEASRAEFSRGLNYDVDYVITTRELIKILQESNIDLNDIEEEEIDQILGEYSGAGIIFGRTGGVIEAAVRTAIEQMTGEKIENIEFECLRGWDGFRSCSISVKDLNLKIGVAYGLKEAAKMLDKIRSGEEFFHAIEIMACTGGCIGGGGQPRAKKRLETIEKRAEGLNNIDRNCDIRRSYENPAVIAIYDKYLDYPMSHKAHELLHTKYYPKIKKK